MNKDNFISFIGLIFIIAIFVIVFAYIGLQIYLWITFGNTPIGEVPAWALWLMLGK